MLEGNSATLKFLSFEGFEQKLTHLVLSPGLFSKSSFLQILSSLPYPPERPRFFIVLHANLPFVIERVWAVKPFFIAGVNKHLHLFSLLSDRIPPRCRPSLTWTETA
jgi:hypothetical protein